MATRSAIGGLVVIRFTFTQGGIPWMTTLHARTADGSTNTSAKMAGLASGVASAANDSTVFNNDTVYTGVTVQDLGPALVPDEIVTATTTGTRGSSECPSTACIVVTLRTGSVGRGFRGRMYLSGGVTGDLTTGGTDWDAGYAADAEGWVNTILVAIPSVTPTAYQAVIYHRKAGEGGSPAADTTTPVLTGVGRTELANQRRRRS